MGVLWCGNEDIDFITRVAGTYSIVTTAGEFRSDYARCAIKQPMTNIATYPALRGNVLASPITDGWASHQIYKWAFSANIAVSCPVFGLAKSGTSGGIFLGNGTGVTKLAIFKAASDGTLTNLAEESTGTFTNSALHKLDLEIVGWNTASGTIRAYMDGSLILTYTGDLRITGVETLDQYMMWKCSSAAAYSANSYWTSSEFIIADTDTRAMGVRTCNPSADGDANAWTNGYGAIDDTAIDDSDNIYVTTATQDFLCNLANMPAGTFSIEAVKIVARLSRGATGISKCSLGIKSGGTVDVDTAHTLYTHWTHEERIMSQNPVTSNNWTSSDIDALQLALRSAT